MADKDDPLPADVRARVWIEARTFFSRESARENCWLWLLYADGRVRAVMLWAKCLGRDDWLPDLLARLDAAPDGVVRDAPEFGWAWALHRAPVVPLPRWAISWGHPAQAALRVFAEALDAEVLAALGRLEVPGPFFGSVENYNRLATLPQPTRRHRLQALGEFPPLVAPILLDCAERPHMFGDGEDEGPLQPYRHDAWCAPVLEAVDRGRDLIGALARHYRVDRALIRSPLFREPWADGQVPRELLCLLHAIPAHARPRDREAVEARLPCLRALPCRVHSQLDAARLAPVFAPGWSGVWRRLEAGFQPLAPAVRDAGDFLRAALGEAELPLELDRLDTDRLGLAWLARRGAISLLEASRRWHAQPTVERAPNDGLPDEVRPVLGALASDGGTAQEIASREALIAEGEAMHHCVGDYWRDCVMDATRILHLVTEAGELATAQYACDLDPERPSFELVELRGVCNAQPAEGMRRFARRNERALNAPQVDESRLIAAREARDARQRYWGAPRQTLRPLDRRSRRELRLVLAWCLKQEDWRSPPDELFRGPIAGFQYAEGPRLLDRLECGDTLELRPEPDNPHDPLAIRVDWNGHKLGYVPRHDNARIARRLNGGIELAAAILALRVEEGLWSAVEFAIAPDAGGLQNADGIGVTE
jgi:hypothetical protein